MSGRRIKGYKYMVIKNQTKMKKEHIQAVMRAANFDNDRYKKFKLNKLPRNEDNYGFI